MKEPIEEGGEGTNCTAERGIGREIQWERMGGSLTTIGPHYMETKEPTTAPSDW